MKVACPSQSEYEPKLESALEFNLLYADRNLQLAAWQVIVADAYVVYVCLICIYYTIYFSQFSLQLSELLARNERQLAKRFLLCQYLCQAPRYLCDSIVYYLLA